jgi:AraC-like DNA-binding protein
VSYREQPAPPPLRGLVECLWGSTAAGPYDVLPDGCMDLLWTGAELLVAGPDTAPHPYRPPTATAPVSSSHGTPGGGPAAASHGGATPEAGAVAAAGLRFRPGVLPALLGVPAAALRDDRVPLELLLPRPARRATSVLLDGADPGPVLARLAAALPGEPPDPGIRAAVVRLARGATAGDTADALGWTSRTLHRRSIAAFGYGPAVLRRVLRFRRALALLRAGLAPADVAGRLGYADQPHLSRDVRAFAGTSPRAVRRHTSAEAAAPAGRGATVAVRPQGG